jgi:hypothetical protein
MPHIELKLFEALCDLKLFMSTRSIIHDNLNCKRCGETNNDVNLDNHGVMLEGDIGAFADVAGCLGRQRPWEKQVINNFNVCIYS